MKISLIVAGCKVKGNDNLLGIGIGGNLPWRLKKEMAHFTKLTKGNGQNAVLMGRKTWESIPTKFRPLKDRYNIIVTTKTDYNLDTDSKFANAFNSITVRLED